MRGRALLRALLSGDATALPGDEAGWRALAARAAELQGEGLLHSVARRAGVHDRLPPTLADRLRRAHALTAAKNLELHAEVTRLLATFSRAGVLAVPMKGAALFRAGVVRDLGARPTVDVDLAVRRAERDRAIAVLAGAGYVVDRSQRSWKHLPAMRRRDLAVELHEIAYWSGSTRAIFDADHLASGEEATRLGRMWALQVHHLVLGSPPDAALTLRTAADVACFARRTATEDALATAATAAMIEAGVEEEGAALDALVAEAIGAPRALPGLPVDPEVASELLARIEAPPGGDPRHEALAHFLATAHRQPLVMLAATARTLLAPAEPGAAAGEGEGEERSAGRRMIARVARPVALAVRVLAALPAAVTAARRSRRLRT